ncbi:serine hydrolase domain-containing protein [Actinoplanes friuliensis]|uniref:Beta-lactamase class C-like protein n=1 Tax=Actinoplanes friuliensis DSM 7358 TaxID=1246995 RepID=U5W485_9ACTN|nr:hydrolase [Actinoplanes friuliensis]AGZ43832.1 beta-lactamase class C-like protein [Actinoplanes friuliensis DSM 7358]
MLLPRSTPAASGVSSRAITALLDRYEAQGIECHSIMVVRHGHVVAEGWWTPYSAERPHLLYSLTKSFTSIAVGLVIADGLLSLHDRVVDVLYDHVPADASEQARRLTVHHLLSMTTGHVTDSLDEAWEREPDDLIRGFLRVPFPEPEGTLHAYDNATTFVLARMVERVTEQDLPQLLRERLFGPMGIDHAEWDLVASGSSFGFHGLHLTTEAVAAFGELLLHGGRWGDRQLVPRDWVELATRRHVSIPDKNDPGFGYGYQFWTSQHGFYGDGAFGQQCVVVPSHDLVVVVTAAITQEGVGTAQFCWETLLPGLDDVDSARDDQLLAERLRGLSLTPVPGSAGPGRSLTAKIEGSVVPSGSVLTVDPDEHGWLLNLGSGIEVGVGHGEWRESSPLGRPVVATGAWQGDTFVAELYVITSPHRVRVEARPGTPTATVTWSSVPLTSPELRLHLRSPLKTRPHNR